MGRIDDLWPLYRLRVRTEDLELRAATDEDLAELAELVREPIHDPGLMPFYEAWTDQPPDRRVRSVLQWQWKARAEWAPEHWHLGLVVVRDGHIVGTQGVHAEHFAVTREVATGSWLGRRYQGQGIGTAMRRAVLHLAFAGLEARTARSGAFADNLSSIAVSHRVGYETDGTEIRDRRGEAGTVIRFLMRREEWEEHAAGWPEVVIEGLDGCRREFGLIP